MSQMSRRSESFGIEGELTVRINPVDTAKPSYIHFQGKNLIVNNGKILLLDQLFYTTGDGNPLNRAKVGTGGSFDPEGLFLKSPTNTMNDLFTPAATVYMNRVARNTSLPSITLLASVDASQCNGLFLNEAGFFAQNGNMFNIKTFPGVLKTDDFTLDLEWVIRID